MLTKFLKAELNEKHVKALTCRTGNGRAEAALRIAGVFAKDSWAEKGEDWVRCHRRPRRCLFTPMKVPNGPTHVAEVGKKRVTKGVFEDGEEFVIVDDWTKSREPHENLGKCWTGKTTFTR